MEEYKFVTNFHVHKNNLGQLGTFYKLLNKISSMGTIKTFTFSENVNLNNFDQGWLLIGSLLRNTRFLEELCISYSYMTDRTFLSLVDSLSGKNLRKLDLSGNFLSFHSIKELVTFLPNFTELEELCLQQNTVNDFKADSVKLIVDVLKEGNKLKKFDISGMNLTGCGVFLKDLFKKCVCLEELGLKGIRMNKDDFQTLLECLEGNEVLRILNIGCNDTNIAETPAKLVDFVAKTKVKKLSIEECGINDDFSMQMIKALKENKTITALVFKNKDFDLYDKLIDVCLGKEGFQVLYIDKMQKKDKELAKKIAKIN